MGLAKQCPFPKRPADADQVHPENTAEQLAFAEQCRKAVLLLIPKQGEPPLSPENQDLLRHAVPHVMMNLFKREREGFFKKLMEDPKVKGNPAHERFLRDIATPSLRLPI